MPRFLLQFDPSAAIPGRLQLQALGVRLVFPRPLFDYLIVDVPGQEAVRLAALPGVLRVEPDKRMSVLPVPVSQELQTLFQAGPLGLLGNPTTLGFRPDTWPTGQSRKIVGAGVADADGITGKGIKVAVLDTGTDPSHPMLLGNTGESMIKTQPLAWDENGHGSHVASTIAGSQFTLHPQGLLQGVAPGAELIIIKVLGGGIGLGDWSDILAGMQRAAELGADILSMSLGGEDVSDPEASEFRVVRQLTERGIICSIAAGNSGPGSQTIGSPGSAPDALTIGAIGKTGIADFSSRGPTLLSLVKPDATAPGVDILSGSTGIIAAYRFLDGLGRFAAISGTSMACPHASGVLALALEYARRRGQTLTTSKVKEALARHYQRSPDNSIGYGLITYPILKQYIDEAF